MLIAFIFIACGSTNSIVAAQAVQGNPLAPVTITEYIDFQCSYCAQAKKTVDEVMKKYNGQVNLVLKHLPLEFHAGALPAARYFEALYQRNPAMAWNFFNLAFSEQTVLKKGEAGVQSLIDKLNLSQEELEWLSQDLNDQLIDERIHADIAEADAMGIDEVPYFFINGHKIENYDQPEEFNQAIDALLLEKNKTNSIR
jgi:protein-disulfide isomerase